MPYVTSVKIARLMILLSCVGSGNETLSHLPWIQRTVMNQLGFDLSELNTKEQNALRYVSGYIVARLPRKVAKKPEREDFMEVVANMKRDHDKDTRLNYTRECVEARSQEVFRWSTT